MFILIGEKHLDQALRVSLEAPESIKDFNILEAYAYWRSKHYLK